MLALSLKKGVGVVLEKFPIPTLDAVNDVLVKLEAAAMNRRDVWITKGMYPGITYGGVMGSDGCGTVVDALDRKDLIGKEVVVDPTFGWETKEYNGTPFSILGMQNGTFADYIAVPARNLHLKPSHLSPEQAAAIPLAGVTAFRAVVSCGQVHAGQNVMITGIGSGVAVFALQFAVAKGANVYVTSSSDEKIKKAMKLGAMGGFNYTHDDWHKQTLKACPFGMDVVIEGGGGDNFAKVISATKSGGKVVVYGATAGPVKTLMLPHIFLKQIQVIGTSMGSSEEFGEMMELIAAHKIVPIVDMVQPLTDYQTVFHQMENSNHMGKLVFQMKAAAKL